MQENRLVDAYSDHSNDTYEVQLGNVNGAPVEPEISGSIFGKLGFQSKWKLGLVKAV